MVNPHAFHVHPGTQRYSETRETGHLLSVEDRGSEIRIDSHDPFPVKIQKLLDAIEQHPDRIVLLDDERESFESLPFEQRLRVPWHWEEDKKINAFRVNFNFDLRENPIEWRGQKITRLKFSYNNLREKHCGCSRIYFYCYTLKLTLDNGKEIFFFFPMLRSLSLSDYDIRSPAEYYTDPLVRNIREFGLELRADQFEIDESHWKSREPINLEYWSRQWEQLGMAPVIYRTIHDNIRSALQSFMRQKRLSDHAIILDAGCGKGCLLEILSKTPEIREGQFWGIERDEMSLRIAKERFSSSLVQDHLIQGNLLELEDILRSKGIRPNCIIFSGILTLGVLPNKEQAQMILIQAYDSLELGGYILIDGFESSWLRRKDYSKIAPSIEPIQWRDSVRPLVILHKPA